MSEWATTLTDAESRICTWVGKMRYADGQYRDPGEGPSLTDKTAANHIRGAHCEYAASLILNLYWRPSIGRINDKDVGGLIQVRSTVLLRGRLIVKPADDDETPFALILQSSNLDYRLLGWKLGKDAKQYPLLTQFGDAAHFISQSELDHNDDLVRWITHSRLALAQT